VPVQLGQMGIEKIVSYNLNNEEREALNRSAEAVRQTTEALKNLVKL